jgi:putative endonuclease
MNYFVYILYSSSNDIYYKGFSEDVEQRLIYHNSNKSKYTAHKGPWVIVYLDHFEDKTAALKREKQLKRQNRAYILWLIQSKKILENG